MLSAVEVVFWVCAGMLVHTQITYPLSLLALTRALGKRQGAGPVGPAELPMVSLVIAAFDEEGVIGATVSSARALDYPPERLEVIVASDGSTDGTAAAAREAGADVVLELPRTGKVAAQNAAVARAQGDVLAFADANSIWQPDALRQLVAALAVPDVGYACGNVSFTGEGGENQEGAYWRYEMKVRSLESALGSITAGNGAIYAVRRDSYVVMPPDRGHDLCLPYLTVRSGLRAVYEPRARASEPLAPSIGAEWQRKRRMMNRTWGVLVADRVLSPRGYGPMYAYAMLSHRGLRYASPFLHVVAFAANVALLGEGPIYAVAFALQLALLAAAALGRAVPLLPFRIARYYVVVTASIAAGLADRIRNGPATTWEPVEGTR